MLDMAPKDALCHWAREVAQRREDSFDNMVMEQTGYPESQQACKNE
jgi:hypothetical protein